MENKNVYIPEDSSPIKLYYENTKTGEKATVTEAQASRDTEFCAYFSRPRTLEETRNFLKRKGFLNG